LRDDRCNGAACNLWGNQFVEQINLPDNHGIEIMRDGVVDQLAGLFPVPVSLII
jgi:hypothetical protein